MPTTTHLNDIWEHTLTEILNHDTKSEGGNHNESMGETQQIGRFQLIVDL